MISIIVAKNNDNLIGYNNTIPWKISEDLKHFKETTLDSNVIMGYNTYQSIGKPLSKRRNIVITRDAPTKYKRSITYFTEQDAYLIEVSSLSSAIDLVEQWNEDAFIIGGGKVYTEALEKNCVDRLIVTEVGSNFAPENGIYFPKIGPEWEMVDCKNLNSEIVAQVKIYERK